MTDYKKMYIKNTKYMYKKITIFYSLVATLQIQQNIDKNQSSCNFYTISIFVNTSDNIHVQ